MHAQSSSAPWNLEHDSDNHGLALVEATRNRRKVALHVEPLSNRRCAIEALCNLSYNVRNGEVFGLQGLNGAGKGALISILVAKRRLSVCSALILGHSIRHESRVIRKMICVRPGKSYCTQMLPAAENPFPTQRTRAESASQSI